jgi:hypothetical protein
MSRGCKCWRARRASPARWLRTIPNNNFANRKLIGLTDLIEFNFNTSKEAGEPNHAGNPGGRSLWWTWTAEADGMAVVTTSGSSIDTVLAVYTGEELTRLDATVTSNDDSGGTLQGKVTISRAARHNISDCSGWIQSARKAGSISACNKTR